MAIAMNVTDNSTVIWESPRQGQKSGGIPPENRPAIERAVVMIREPVVRIQPGRNASRLGNRRVKEFPSITASVHAPWVMASSFGAYRVYVWRPLMASTSEP